MNIYIDTSVYLGFYELGERGKIEPFEELKKLINTKRIQILLPEHVIDEFYRRRGSLAALYLKSLNEQIASLKKGTAPTLAPCIVSWKDYKKRKHDFEKSIESAISVIEDIKTIYLKEIEDDKNVINHTIEAVFESAKKIPVTYSVLEKAKWRRFKANPPGKEGNNGDAINWEALLANSEKSPLMIVSYDKDWFNPLKKAPHEFIVREWRKNKASKLSITDTLGEAINEISDKPTVSKKAIEAEKQMRDKSTAFFMGTDIGISNPMAMYLDDYHTTKINKVIYFNDDQAFLQSKFYGQSAYPWLSFDHNQLNKNMGQSLWGADQEMGNRPH